MSLQIPLGKSGLYASVDPDSEYLSSFSWRICRYGNNVYAQRHVWKNGIRTVRKMHQDVLGFDSTRQVHIHHKDGNGLNNTKQNLEIIGHSKHRGISARRIPVSGFRGVSVNGSNWMARITTENVTLYLGRFPTIKQAALAYDAKAVELHGEQAVLNFP